MTRSAAIVALLLATAFLAGCLDADAPPEDAPAVVAASAEEAGAQSGEAPVAPKEAYEVAPETVAYPVAVETNAARAPVSVDLSGVVEPMDCRPLNFGPLEDIALQSASRPQRFADLSEHFRVGDVFSYHILMTYTNAPDNWAELHASYGIGSTVVHHEESTQEMTDVVIEWKGQGYRASEDDMAWIFVGCPFARMQTPIAYTLTVSVTYAEGAVPAEAPMLLSVPEDATKLFVRGVAVDAEQGVLSHFRLFDPQDQLFGELALSSSETVATFDLPEGGGDYVLLVDHTENGFLSIALDVPTETPLRALPSEWVERVVLSADGGPVDVASEIVLEKVPLHMFARVLQKEQAGLGQSTSLTLTNGRGQVLHAAWGGHLAWADPVGGDAWLGIGPGEWAYELDHHAYAPGPHNAAVKADFLRGDILLVTREYVR